MSVNRPSMTDEAYWTRGSGRTGYANLEGRGRADVAVIGGGAAGLWTAWELALTGRRVALVEARRVAEAAKGGRAGQASVLQGLAYSRIARAAGPEAARCYAEAQTKAVQRIAEVADRLGVPCGLERRASYVYATDAASLAKLNEELAAAQEAGVAAVYGTGAGLPFADASVAASLQADDQLQFDP